MRPSLIPGLAAAARRNADRGAASIRLFEIGRRYLAEAERPTVGILLAGEKHAAQLAGGQGARLRSRSTPRPRRWRCSKRPARRSPTCSSTWAPGETWHPGRSATLGPGQERSSPRSASCIRAWPRRSMRRPGRSRRKSISTPFPRRASSERARAGLRAAGAAAGDARFRFPRSGRPGRRCAGPRDPRRRQGGDHRRAAVRPISRASRG